MFDKIFSFVSILVVLAVVFGLCFLIFYACSEEVIETYSVGCEVSQMAYATTSTRSIYKMGVRNDDFAVTFEINSNQFAQYVEGDIVEVLVCVIEDFTGNIRYEYELLGTLVEKIEKGA